MEYRCGSLLFFSNFDSGNLARVEPVNSGDQSSRTIDGLQCDAQANSSLGGSEKTKTWDLEFNLWTAPDCQGTVFENGNRSWFHFGVKGGRLGQTIKLNIMNMNKQGKLYSQGMMPLVRTTPSKNTRWLRIRDRPSYMVVDGQFILSFVHTFSESRNSTTYFAFCYPYSYEDCQRKLEELDQQYASVEHAQEELKEDSIYYHRDLLTRSLQGRRVDLISITSCRGLETVREASLPGLFPKGGKEKRCHQFSGKKVFVLTSRVHPGETPASFVFNGFLQFILRENDPRAALLRHLFVFKLVPLLNPDGVSLGFYRTDTRGVNLNRVYLDPDPSLHPSVFAVKTLMMYHHTNRVQRRLCCICTHACRSAQIQPSDSHGDNRAASEGKPHDLGDQDSSRVEEEESLVEGAQSAPAIVDGLHVDAGLLSEPISDALKRLQEDKIDSDELPLCVEREEEIRKMSELQEQGTADRSCTSLNSNSLNGSVEKGELCNPAKGEPGDAAKENLPETRETNECLVCPCGGKLTKTLPSNIDNNESGLGCYVDLHGHASKRGCFMYANRLARLEDQISCLLLPKLLALNCAHFDFNACNFSERNMCMPDKRDGTTKEGSGRVAMFKATGLIHSYTLECNYNSGKMVNVVPPATNDGGRATPPPLPCIPTRFTPSTYEDVGRALAISVLDIVEQNPWSRLPSSEHRNLSGLQAWLKKYLQSLFNAPELPKKFAREISRTSSLIASSSLLPTQIYLAKSGTKGPKNGISVPKPKASLSCDKSASVVIGENGSRLRPPVRKTRVSQSDAMRPANELKERKTDVAPLSVPKMTSSGVPISTSVLHFPASHSFLEGLGEQNNPAFTTTLVPRKEALPRPREGKLKKINAVVKKGVKQSSSYHARSSSWDSNANQTGRIPLQAEVSKKVLASRQRHSLVIEDSAFVPLGRVPCSKSWRP